MSAHPEPTVLKTGSLLVSVPELLDPNFRRTVIYLVAHGEDGTVGVVLNRMSETAVQNVLPAWAGLTARPQAMYVGGPVQPSSAMCLGVCRPGVDPREVPGTVPVTGSVVLVSLDTDPEEMRGYLSGIRLFAGRAGWTADQLRSEVDDGAWRVVPGRDGDVLAGAKTDLWFEVLRRQPWPDRLAAYHPGDLERN
ncbi:YqgE/AlgH family protein [Nakamurella leprariae]|uniref:YqgE/AlgH family protein n=1 Tax=Nakamurella leprariae TaxID=2803911 RepID=A0A938YJI6_9ACTN|nr:YqgE/AlgH family protein [Nakamurella leprariae]MBM9468950.1 YqgE/AlgH family protein [Nakamurella leprariae]